MYNLRSTNPTKCFQCRYRYFMQLRDLDNHSRECCIIKSIRIQWIDWLTCSRCNTAHRWFAKPYLGPSSGNSVALNGSCSICQSNSVSSPLASSSSCSPASASASQRTFHNHHTKLQNHVNSWRYSNCNTICFLTQCSPLQEWCQVFSGAFKQFYSCAHLNV